MKILDNILNKKQISCNDELNILDIDDNICYFLDGYKSLYIKVTPIAFEYLSIEEKKRIINKVINELAGESETIKIITMSLPISTKEINDFFLKCLFYIRKGATVHIYSPFFCFSLIILLTFLDISFAYISFIIDLKGVTSLLVELEKVSIPSFIATYLTICSGK